MPATYVIGDIHGQYDKLIRLLRGVPLIDDELVWRGGDAILWFMGDFVDRGPRGIAVIEVVMRLQRQAPMAGGQVHALLGNHELLLLAAQRFADRPSTGPGGTFRADWANNGGVPDDLRRLSPAHIMWLTRLPAMEHVGDHLFIHADAWFYARYGRSVAEVNQTIAALLNSEHAVKWDQLLHDFSERNGFGGQKDRGEDRAKRFLQLFGGGR